MLSLQHAIWMVFHSCRGNMSIHPTQMTQGRSSTSIKQHIRFLFMVCLWPIRLEAFSVGQTWSFATSRSARSVQLRYHSKGEGWAEGCHWTVWKFEKFQSTKLLMGAFFKLPYPLLFQSLQTGARNTESPKEALGHEDHYIRWLRWKIFWQCHIRFSIASHCAQVLVNGVFLLLDAGFSRQSF